MADRQAWILCALRRYERPLVRYARRVTGDLESARDVVQECFLRLCRQRKERVQGHLGAWLYSVCRNLAFDRLRKEGRMQALDDSTPGPKASPVARLERREQFQSVAASIERLPPRQQEILRLKFQENLSYRQIAAVTKLSVSNVGFVLHTAIRTLRSALGDQLREVS
jgi:RNA polymerase sigma-70 factor (ECF subfamily)